MIKIKIVENEQEMSAQAAWMIAEAVRGNPEIVLSLPTGSTPVGTLKEIVRLHREEGLDFSQATSFNMDEYVGLSKNHEQGYYRFLKDHFYDHVNIRLDRTFSPDAVKGDLVAAVEEFEATIEESGGFDLTLLGIGRDGHISFNMPGENLMTGVHIESLSEETIADNARFFDDTNEVPQAAITIGIGTILKSKKIILIANGTGKRQVIEAFLKDGVLNPQLPATFLKLHPDVTVIVDKAAAGDLTR